MKKKKVPAGKHKAGGAGKQASWKQGGGAKAKATAASGGSKENVFETLWTRRKFDVLGKKNKGGDAKRVGQARSAALDKRKKSLLQEYKQRGKTNAFLDHRFGEHDESLGDEDKAILRFQKERMVQMQKKSKFTLDDADDDDDDGEPSELLTHGGNALSSFDDFRDDISIEDDDDAGLSADVVRDLHFGGGFVGKKGGEDGDEEGKRRSKKEVMEEVIAKSKYFKAQKAKEKEEDHDLKAKLDADFTAMVQTGAFSSLVRPKKGDALKSFLARGTTVDAKAGNKMEEVKEKPDDFDKLVREMGFEMRAHASDRSKTAEELAKEERTRLEELEKKRKQRMLGIADSDDDEDADESDEVEGEQSRRQQKKKREISGDDLGGNFVIEDEYKPEQGWVDEVLARKDDSDEDDEDDDDDEEDDEEDGSEDEEGSSEGSEDEDGSESDDWERSDDEGIPKLSSKDQALLDKLLAAKKGPHAEKEVKHLLDKESKMPSKEKKPLSVAAPEVDNALPYLIDAPQTLLEFRHLVDHRSTEDLETAVERIRKCNAISLAAENRRKMQVFYNVLVQYFATLAGERPLRLQRINSLVKPLIEMSGECHYYAATCARERIIRMQKQLSENLQSTDDISCWPSNRILLLFRLWSMIFPPSDFRHAVMTPAMLLMSEYLLRCPVKSGHDVAVGTFICSLLLSVMRPAKRFCPEALSFLQALLLSALPKMDRSKGLPDVALHCPSHLVEYVASKQWLRISSSKAAAAGDVQPLDFISLLTADGSATVFESDSFKVGILFSVMKTLSGFVDIYSDISSFPEVFSPFVPLLEALREGNVLPEGLRTLTAEVHELIAEKVKEHESSRQPLLMRMSKPVPIKTFNPQFEENYVKGRDYDPDRERAETKKLKKQLKRDAKGAARELRKDNWFLADEKAKENAVLQQEREEKYNKALSFLEQQESAFKSGQLGKGKGRKRKSR